MPVETRPLILVSKSKLKSRVLSAHILWRHIHHWQTIFAIPETRLVHEGLEICLRSLHKACREVININV